MGSIAVLGAFNMFVPDPITMMVRFVFGGLALAAAIVAIVRYRRAGRPAPPVGVAGIVLSGLALALTLLSLLQFAFFFVFAERLETPPEPVTSAQAAAEQAATEREFAEVAAASAEMLEVVRLPDGSYPTRLAVTTDQRQLISPDGVVIADLPFDTSVNVRGVRRRDAVPTAAVRSERHARRGRLGGRDHRRTRPLRERR